VCSVPISPTNNPGEEGAKSYALRLPGMKSAEVVSVNMNRLGESFVKKVSDVRRRATVDGQAAAPGESLEFLAHIRGCQLEARKQRRDKLLQLNDIGLRGSRGSLAGLSFPVASRCICRCSRMRARLSPPRVLLPHTYTQDGWFLQPERRPAGLPRRTIIFSLCICRCSRMRARLLLHIFLLHTQVSR
jgi:hypothetical protein